MTRTQMGLAGGGLLVLGLLIGYGLGSGGPDIEEIDQAVAARIDVATAAEADRVTALDGKVDALSGRLDEIAASVASGSEAVTTMSEKVGADLESLGAALSERVETATAEQAAALESGISSLRTDISARPVAAPAAPAAKTAAAPAAAEGAPPAGDGAGRTALLSGGAVRVFISRVDDAAGSARLLINGESATLKAGESRTLQALGKDCRVTLVAIDRGHVVFAGGCGDELPEPEGAAAGAVVSLGDGAVRVFVSGVTEAGARIAVNGVETKTVPVGEAVAVRVNDQDCRVSVRSVDRGRVALDYGCGS